MQESSSSFRASGKLGAASSDGVALERLREALAREPGDDFLKHVKLRRAILAMIHAGHLVPGQQLPAEQKLAGVLALSLGTVRQCLGRLADEGVLVREHGRGTFIADAARTNYRFVDPAGIAPGVLARHLRTSVAPAPQAAAELFGQPNPLGTECIRVDRAIRVGGEMSCYSEFFVDAHRFAALLDVPFQTFGSMKMHEVLARRFNAPTLHVAPYVRAVTFPAHVRDHVGADCDSGILMELAATSFDRRALSYQAIFVPEGRFRLDISNLVVPIEAEDICGI